MARPEALYRWRWNGRRWRAKPYYIIACRWCYGTYEAARSDSVSGGGKCRRALSRYNRALARGEGRKPGGRYAATVKRFSHQGRQCASTPPGDE